ncbi:Periplasmic hemin-binding protein [Sporomusa ovata]|uniref:Periplasmic hemin-binding protein n=2 Tax=Sporomusa ovata TaxID=2378 RepID=A0A0U1KX74_9FIRM|nr:Periplasmic hemin-binding protein [Sporomusa ovata]
MLLVLGLLLVFTGGCTEKNNSSLPYGKSTAGSGGYEVVDSTGYVLQLPQKPQRIVALSISTAEITMALVDPERIAALVDLADVSGVSNIVEQAKAVPKKVQANAESVIALQPDLVIIPDWRPAALAQTLREVGIPVYVYKTATTIDEVKQSITIIAHVVGEEQAGERLVAEMETQLEQVNEKVRQIPKDSQQVVIRFSLMGDGGGKGSTFEDICRQAGVIEGAALAGLSREDVMSKEQIVSVNPDVILLPAWDYTGKTDITKFAEDVQNDPALQSVKAIRNKKMVAVPDRHLTATSQYIVLGVQDVVRAVYPQYF